MKVHQLIEKLKGMDEDAEVLFAYNYGDHLRTQVAAEMKHVDEGLVTYSEYHRMFKVEDDDKDQDEPGVKAVVIIQS